MSAPDLFDAPGPRARAQHALWTGVGVVVAAAVVVGVLYRLGTTGQLEADKWTPFLDPVVWREYLVPGLVGTLGSAGVSVVLAIAFGVVFGSARLSRHRVVAWPAGVVVEFFRAVPVLIMMIFAFNVYAVNAVFDAGLNPFMAVVTALTLYNGSVIAELVRSGVRNLPAGQFEAGLSIGLTTGQTLRSIQLPQALTAMLPALVGQMVVVLKDSALGYQITYLELLNWSRTLGSAYANTVPAYIVAAVLFIVLNIALGRLAGYLERRLREGRGAARTAAGPVEPQQRVGASAQR